MKQIQTLSQNINKICPKNINKKPNHKSQMTSSIPRKSKQLQYESLFEADSDKKTEFIPPQPITSAEQYKFSSAYFKDHVEQQYQIYRAFNANNFTYLRNLPDNFKHGQILNDRKQKVTKLTQQQTLNRTKLYEQKLVDRQKKINEKKKEKIGTLGYFNKFQYTQSNYQIPKLLETIQRKQSDKKRSEISQLDFRPSGVQAKMKYQDPFKYLDKISSLNEQNSSNQNYLFPFHISEDTYNQFHQSQKRRKIISDAMKLNGDFIPAKKQKILSKTNKQQLGEIINQIEILLKKYLKNIGFFIGVTSNDYIQVLFEEKQQFQNKISMFMSRICEHQLISKYMLRRNIYKWCYLDKQKGYTIYCILPNWVKNPQQSLQKK